MNWCVTGLRRCLDSCAAHQVSQAGILAFQQLVQLLPTARATAASKRAVDRLESQGSDDGTLAAVRLLAHTVAFWTPEALKRHVPRYAGRWASHRDFAVREVSGVDGGWCRAANWSALALHVFTHTVLHETTCMHAS